MTQQDKLKVPGEFEVIAYDCPDFIGDYTQIDYGDPLSPRSSMLLDEFPIEDAVSGCASEFEEQLALKRWVRSQWNHGWSVDFDTVTDGLDILRSVAKGEQFCCGHYARVFADCATALGWPARLVGLSIEACGFPRNYNVGNVGHAVAEVWSNDLRKWVAMDPDLNCHYECDGVPLSALEVNQGWLGDGGEQIALIKDEPEFVLPTGPTVELAGRRTPGLNRFDEETCRLLFERFGRHQAKDYYARLSIGSRQWVDRRCLPTFVCHFAPAGAKRWTSNPDDLYWTLNMARLGADPSWDETGAALVISPDHCMPWFDHYEVRVDGGEWERKDMPFSWPMHNGANRLECRAVNVRDRKGIVSTVDVSYTPAIW